MTLCPSQRVSKDDDSSVKPSYWRRGRLWFREQWCPDKAFTSSYLPQPQHGGAAATPPTQTRTNRKGASQSEREGTQDPCPLPSTDPFNAETPVGFKGGVFCPTPSSPPKELDMAWGSPFVKDFQARDTTLLVSGNSQKKDYSAKISRELTSENVLPTWAMIWKYYNQVRLDGATPRTIMQHVPLGNWILKHQSSCPAQTINWIYVEALFLTDEIL